MKYARTFQREDSISVSEAVEHIKKRTGKRRHSCARKFAEALMNLSPELAFWQNVPPDMKDLSPEQSAQITDFLRRAVSERHDTDARIIGPWIYDVYGGSRKKGRCGNKWDDPYPYFYKDDFQKSQLPLPLMKDFRADRTIMKSICSAAIESISPRGRKTANIATWFLDNAAQQVAAKLSQGHVTTLSEIENRLRSLADTDRYWDPPITEIVFVSADQTKSDLGKAYDYDLIVVRWQDEVYETKSKTNSLDTFTRKVKKYMT